MLTLFVQMVEITKIGCLDGKNYQSWKYDIKFVLMEHGLWRFVEGTETAPGVSVAVTVQNASDLPSHKAYSLIALSVVKSLQVHISLTADPREAWEILRKQFECVWIAGFMPLQ